jgi:hypothetical protein
MIRTVKKTVNKQSHIVYNPSTNGNVFNWILLKAETVRQLRRIQRNVAEKAAKESEGLGYSGVGD